MTQFTFPIAIVSAYGSNRFQSMPATVAFSIQTKVYIYMFIFFLISGSVKIESNFTVPLKIYPAKLLPKYDTVQCFQ